MATSCEVGQRHLLMGRKKNKGPGFFDEPEGFDPDRCMCGRPKGTPRMGCPHPQNHAPIFNAQAGETLREEAIERVEKANEEWVTDAYNAGVRIAKEYRYFTTDHIWDAIGGVPEGVEPRAMGPVMRRLQSAKVVVPSERMPALSEMPACHRRPKKVWQSLIWVPF